MAMPDLAKQRTLEIPLASAAGLDDLMATQIAVGFVQRWNAGAEWDESLCDHIAELSYKLARALCLRRLLP